MIWAASVFVQGPGAARGAPGARSPREVRALLVIVSADREYLCSAARSLSTRSPRRARYCFRSIAGAIAEKERAYESFDVPKGTLRGSPPLPSDDLTTLRVSFYLVARKKLDADIIAELTQSLMNARRDLLGEMPILAQVATPDTDPDAYLLVHPGAAAFYNGTQQTFLDKWGNAIFLAPMILGGLVSVLMAAWKFLRMDDLRNGEKALDALDAVGHRIRTTQTELELSEIEREIDKVLQNQREKAKGRDENALDVTTLNVVAHRLQSLIHDRRIQLAAQLGDMIQT